ncbi:MAG: phosphoglycerate kinase [Pararhodobacter sp.]|nr:phosphoglycerate kinase [Pararhodobacter sp.]
MSWKTLDDMDFADKAVLIRVDINVPVENGQVTDDTRIRAILPTIRHVTSAGGKAVLLAHFGRPKGKPVPEMSLAPVRPALEAALGEAVGFAGDCIGLPAKRAVADLKAGQVLLLENTRFHEGEEKNDPAFAAALGALGEVYVNDAFSAAHRAHASTEGLAHLLPACAGRQMEAELRALEAALGHPDRPVVAVVGGAKISTKLDLLNSLVEKVDDLIIGGGMANTFMAAQGRAVGMSLCEHELADSVHAIMQRAQAAGCRVHLPSDLVVAREFAAHAPHEVVAECPPDAMILDAGPDTVAAVRAVFDNARTLIWNGPLGAFEIEPFDAATNAAASHAAALTQAGTLRSVAGGGDTVAALNRAGVAGDFSYLSTAGGAFLEWMEGRVLPGVAALSAER